MASRIDSSCFLKTTFTHINQHNVLGKKGKNKIFKAD